MSRSVKAIIVPARKKPFLAIIQKFLCDFPARETPLGRIMATLDKTMASARQNGDSKLSRAGPVENGVSQAVNAGGGGTVNIRFGSFQGGVN